MNGINTQETDLIQGKINFCTKKNMKKNQMKIPNKMINVFSLKLMFVLTTKYFLKPSIKQNLYLSTFSHQAFSLNSSYILIFFITELHF